MFRRFGVISKQGVHGHDETWRASPHCVPCDLAILSCVIIRVQRLGMNEAIFYSVWSKKANTKPGQDEDLAAHCQSLRPLWQQTRGRSRAVSNKRWWPYYCTTTTTFFINYPTLNYMNAIWPNYWIFRVSGSKRDCITVHAPHPPSPHPSFDPTKRTLGHNMPNYSSSSGLDKKWNINVLRWCLK